MLLSKGGSLLSASRRIRPLSRRGMSTLPPKLFQVEEAVKEALANGKPVVALESTIIAHGMPFPQNLELANELESILRAKGVTPATKAKAIASGIKAKATVIPASTSARKNFLLFWKHSINFFKTQNIMSFKYNKLFK